MKLFALFKADGSQTYFQVKYKALNIPIGAKELLNHCNLFLFVFLFVFLVFSHQFAKPSESMDYPDMAKEAGNLLMKHLV